MCEHTHVETNVQPLAGHLSFFETEFLTDLEFIS